MDFLNDIAIEKSYWNTHSVLIPFIFSNDPIITILKNMTSSERGSIFEMEETHKKLECFNVPVINFNRGKMVLRNNLKSAKKLGVYGLNNCSVNFIKNLKRKCKIKVNLNGENLYKFKII